ncbi:hypothetical protein EVAR_28797_1 [Eumeta japonica]|uniref:Uncharacterized protein n=1 Tax=Eumeta variegata TaxID=151549 RepID=A0A4C1VI01_EUMVA|nr:hypothetical protein EVAR_28797_1 [Eumeta japonica]
MRVASDLCQQWGSGTKGLKILEGCVSLHLIVRTSRLRIAVSIRRRRDGQLHSFSIVFCARVVCAHATFVESKNKSTASIMEVTDEISD